MIAKTVQRALWSMGLLLAGGCSTPLMKPTPFYEGKASAYTDPIEDRVNLWPLVYHRAPATSVLWPMFSFSDDHLAVRPFYSQYRQKGAGSDYDEFSFLWPYCQINTRDGDGWAFPFFWSRDRFLAFPFFCSKENHGKHDLYVGPLLSSAHWDDRSEAYSWYALCGLASSQANKQGIGKSWCLPFYYHKDDKEFTSLLYSWSEENGTRTTDWLTPLVGTVSGAKDGFWIWPICEYTTEGNYESLRQDVENAHVPSAIKYQMVSVTNGTGKVEQQLRPLPQGSAKMKGVALGIFKWSKEIFDTLKGKTKEEYVLAETTQNSCPLAYDSKMRHSLIFDSTSLAKKGERLEASSNLLGLLYNSERHVDTFKNIDRSRARILHWFWNREEDNGNVSIDMLPGYTYDSKTNGYFKTSFLWRFFRYEDEPGQNPKMDILYLPILR